MYCTKSMDHSKRVSYMPRTPSSLQITRSTCAHLPLYLPVKWLGVRGGGDLNLQERESYGTTKIEKETHHRRKRAEL